MRAHVRRSCSGVLSRRHDANASAHPFAHVNPSYLVAQDAIEVEAGRALMRARPDARRDGTRHAHGGHQEAPLARAVRTTEDGWTAAGRGAAV